VTGLLDEVHSFDRQVDRSEHGCLSLQDDALAECGFLARGLVQEGSVWKGQAIGIIPADMK
jgi:hypothetical protein